MTPWLMGSRVVRTVVMIAGALGAFALMMLGQRKQGEKIGAMKTKLENANAAQKVQDKMADVPRPDRADVADKLRHGKF